jgi:hypothetical protein
VHPSKKSVEEGEGIRCQEHFFSVFGPSERLSRDKDAERLFKMFHVSQLLLALMIDHCRKE